MIRARSTRLAGSVRDRAISCNLLPLRRITDQRNSRAKPAKLSQHIDVLESMH
jgi:hypothetical protein